MVEIVLRDLLDDIPVQESPIPFVNLRELDVLQKQEIIRDRRDHE